MFFFFRVGRVDMGLYGDKYGHIGRCRVHGLQKRGLLFEDSRG